MLESVAVFLDSETARKAGCMEHRDVASCYSWNVFALKAFGKQHTVIWGVSRLVINVKIRCRWKNGGRERSSSAAVVPLRYTVHIIYSL